MSSKKKIDLVRISASESQRAIEERPDAEPRAQDPLFPESFAASGNVTGQLAVFRGEPEPDGGGR